MPSYIQTICMLFNHYCLKKYVVVCPPSRVLSYIFIVMMMDQACEYGDFKWIPSKEHTLNQQLLM